MSVAQEEAREALRLAREAQARSVELRGYQSAAPHLMLWGVAYALGFTIQFFRPGWNGVHWAVLSVIAGTTDWLISRIDRPGGRAKPAMFLGLTATFLVFIVACLAVFQPRDPRQVAAFFPLVVALAYILFGVIGLPRLVWTGVALGALTIFGFFALPQIFLLWMAVVGGGALFLGGLWMRRT